MAFAMHEIYAEFVEASGMAVEDQLSFSVMAHVTCATEAGVSRDSRATRNRRRGMAQARAIGRRKAVERTRAALAEVRARRRAMRGVA